MLGKRGKVFRPRCQDDHWTCRTGVRPRASCSLCKRRATVAAGITPLRIGASRSFPARRTACRACRSRFSVTLYPSATCGAWPGAACAGRFSGPHRIERTASGRYAEAPPL